MRKLPLLLRYRCLVKERFNSSFYTSGNDLRYWQNELFLNFLLYGLPVSVIALAPGIYMSLRSGYTLVAVVDAGAFLMFAIATFSRRLSLRNRKIMVMAIFYGIAVFLINTLGYIGPGVFYLFGTTVLIALIFPVRVSYWSVAANTGILVGFAIIIKFQLFHSALLKDYTVGKWLAFSSNVTFLSLVFALLINRIFEGLLITIRDKDHLQERYKSIFDKSPLPMWVFDTGTLQFLEVNEAAIRHYGYSKEEFLAMTILDIRLAGDADGIRKRVKENAISGIFYKGHSRQVRKNGELMYILTQSNMISWENKMARLVLATDITGQLESEQAVHAANQRIKDSESNLRALFENARDGFVLLDAQNCIKVFNTRAKDFMLHGTGTVKFEAGRSIFEYTGYVEGVHFDKMINLAHQGENTSFDHRRERDGVTKWIKYLVTPVYEEKKISGVCITARDITANKQYINTIERQNKILREISWMQSHLVRAPLARIMGLTDLLNTCPDDPCQREELIKFLKSSSLELDDVLKEIVYKSGTVYDLQDIEQK